MTGESDRQGVTGRGRELQEGVTDKGSCILIPSLN